MDFIIDENYALYNGDCIDLIQKLPDKSIDLSVYSPPFVNLYTYSPYNEDLGNSSNYEEFKEHYMFLIKEMKRVIKPGRIVAVHCMDIPNGKNGLRDFPGDIIRWHIEAGFNYWTRFTVWKEPLKVAIRTRLLGLRHAQLIKDSSKVIAAPPDYVLIFRNSGENQIPITHSQGLTEFSGDISLYNEDIRNEFQEYYNKYRNFKGEQKFNKFSQWIWRRYASSVWMDVRSGRGIEFETARESEDERHVCPLQLDIIDRIIQLYSNERETVLTPFMGVGSEVYSAIRNKRKGIGFELKPSYYKVAVKNVKQALQDNQIKENSLEFDFDVAN